MAEKRKLRGFTRADALVAGVVCLVLVLLVAVLLGKPRERSIRMVCAANLAQIGKTMFLYANDNEDALPRAGGPTTVWGPLYNWVGLDRHMAFGLAADGNGGKATVNSSFFLLVKYYQAPTRLFLCRGDKGTAEFKLSNLMLVPPSFELVDAWDFGWGLVSYRSCSFSYHLPYGQYALTTSRDPNLAVAADRNPWLKSPWSYETSPVGFRPDLPEFAGSPETACIGNTPIHNRDGQNVLFLDGAVRFETRAYCGLDKDNIYTVSNAFEKGTPLGIVPTTASHSSNERDSFLVHDPDAWGSPSGQTR